MTQERADEDVELAKTNFDVLKGWAILKIIFYEKKVVCLVLKIKF